MKRKIPLITTLSIFLLLFIIAFSTEENNKIITEKNKNNIIFPKHWGSPPPDQINDYRKLPAGYGYGSTTLLEWVNKKIYEDTLNYLYETKPDPWIETK